MRIKTCLLIPSIIHYFVALLFNLRERKGELSENITISGNLIKNKPMNFANKRQIKGFKASHKILSNLKKKNGCGFYLMEIHSHI